MQLSVVPRTRRAPLRLKLAQQGPERRAFARHATYAGHRHPQVAFVPAALGQAKQRASGIIGPLQGKGRRALQVGKTAQLAAQGVPPLAPMQAPGNADVTTCPLPCLRQRLMRHGRVQRLERPLRQAYFQSDTLLFQPTPQRRSGRIFRPHLLAAFGFASCQRAQLVGMGTPAGARGEQQEGLSSCGRVTQRPKASAHASQPQVLALGKGRINRFQQTHDGSKPLQGLAHPMQGAVSAAPGQQQLVPQFAQLGTRQLLQPVTGTDSVRGQAFSSR